jgi:hypothetical protein
MVEVNIFGYTPTIHLLRESSEIGHHTHISANIHGQIFAIVLLGYGCHTSDRTCCLDSGYRSPV